jgi:hypothetical protein
MAALFRRHDPASTQGAPERKSASLLAVEHMFRPAARFVDLCGVVVLSRGRLQRTSVEWDLTRIKTAAYDCEHGADRVRFASFGLLSGSRVRISQRFAVLHSRASSSGGEPPAIQPERLYAGSQRRSCDLGYISRTRPAWSADSPPNGLNRWKPKNTREDRESELRTSAANSPPNAPMTVPAARAAIGRRSCSVLIARHAAPRDALAMSLCASVHSHRRPSST